MVVDDVVLPDKKKEAETMVKTFWNDFETVKRFDLSRIYNIKALYFEGVEKLKKSV